MKNAIFVVGLLVVASNCFAAEPSIGGACCASSNTVGTVVMGDSNVNGYGTQCVENGVDKNAGDGIGTDCCIAGELGKIANVGGHGTQCLVP